MLAQNWSRHARWLPAGGAGRCQHKCSRLRLSRRPMGRTASDPRGRLAEHIASEISVPASHGLVNMGFRVVVKRLTEQMRLPLDATKVRWVRVPEDPIDFLECSIESKYGPRTPVPEALAWRPQSCLDSRSGTLPSHTLEGCGWQL